MEGTFEFQYKKSSTAHRNTNLKLNARIMGTSSFYHAKAL